MQRHVSAPAPIPELPTKQELRGSIQDDEDHPTTPTLWYNSLGVRFVVALLALFALVHLFLWKMVYDFWVNQDHERLSKSIREAWKSLDQVRQHLEHFGRAPKEEL